MKRAIITFITFILLIGIISAQDTTRLNPSKIFDSKNFKQTKNMYAQELIKVTKDSFLIENCYYLINKKQKIERRSYCTSKYKIESDSMLYIWEYNNLSIWNFKIINDSLYSVRSEFETGSVSTLIPFIKHGEFITYKDNDTLIISHYNNGYLQNYFIHQNNDITDTIYQYNEVDTPPLYPGGEESLRNALKFVYSSWGISPECQLQGNVFIKIVVSKTGAIKNIKVMKGIDPFIEYASVRIVSELENFTPGMCDNKPVNVEMIVAVKCVLQ